MIINTVLTTDSSPTTHASTHAVNGSDPITPSSIGAAASSDLANKVDKVSGKQLSTEDYTSAEKTKLAGIATGAEVNVQSDWNAESGDALILNKPSSMTPTAHASTHASNGSDPITPSSIGAEPAITKASAFNKAFGTAAPVMDGTASAGTADSIARSDHIHPTDTSRASATDLANHLSASNPHSITKSTIGLPNVVDGAQVNVIETVQKNGTALTVTNKTVNVTVPTKTSELTNDSGYITSAPVTSVNTKTGAVTLAAEDVGALPDTTTIPSTLAELTADATHRLVSDTEKSTWNGKQNALTFDDTPTQNSSNPVKSGGIYSALAGKEPVITRATAFNKAFGTAADTVCEGNDSRLSDARTPTAHAATHNIGGTDAIATASSSSSGLLSGTDWNTFNSKQDLQTGYFLSIIPPNASLTKSNIDSNGVYLTYTWDISKITGANQKAGRWVSTLSSDYTRRTLTVYDIDKSNVVFSCVFSRTLDSYGNLVSEVLQ